MVLPIAYTSQQPIDDFGLNFSDLLWSATLAQNVDTQLIIPGNARRYKALIKTFPSMGGEVWVAVNTAAVLPVAPTGGFLNSTSSEVVSVVGLCREVKSGDVLHFNASQADTDVSVVLYAINTIN